MLFCYPDLYMSLLIGYTGFNMQSVYGDSLFLYLEQLYICWIRRPSVLWMLMNERVFLLKAFDLNIQKKLFDQGLQCSRYIFTKKENELTLVVIKFNRRTKACFN